MYMERVVHHAVVSNQPFLRSARLYRDVVACRIEHFAIDRKTPIGTTTHAASHRHSHVCKHDSLGHSKVFWSAGSAGKVSGIAKGAIAPALLVEISNNFTAGLMGTMAPRS
jgi:hypothetical protein